MSYTISCVVGKTRVKQIIWTVGNKEIPLEVVEVNITIMNPSGPNQYAGTKTKEYTCVDIDGKIHILYEETFNKCKVTLVYD